MYVRWIVIFNIRLQYIPLLFSHKLIIHDVLEDLGGVLLAAARLQASMLLNDGQLLVLLAIPVHRLGLDGVQQVHLQRRRELDAGVIVHVRDVSAESLISRETDATLDASRRR